MSNILEKKLQNFFVSKGLKFAPSINLENRKISENYSIKQGNDVFLFNATTHEYIDSIYITEVENGFTVKRTFKNTSEIKLNLKELEIHIEGIDLGLNPNDDFYYHVDNPRLFQRMTIPVDFDRLGNVWETEFDAQAGNKWVNANDITERIGTSPCQPFPALLVSNYGSNLGYVFGTLSQDVFYHNYYVKHIENKISLTLFSSFKYIDYREVAPGEILVDEWYLGKTKCADRFEFIFKEYSDELRKKLSTNYGATNINRDNLVWGTWNDGIFRDISEEMILAEAKALKENFPTVKWLQIDDGYSILDDIAHGLGVPYEGEEGIDKNKFPSGMRYVSDMIRLSGLRPAIWIGGLCPTKSKIVCERPDLLVEKDDQGPDRRILDVSIPTTREYVKSALDTMITDWGFDGVKLDFWSYPFELSKDGYKNRDKSGYEYREWLTLEFRKRLASDGHFQTGCDIAMGNPFLGKYFTNYRYGIDIGSGNWDNLKINYLWCIACIATHTGDLFVPNSDAIGMFPGLSDIDAKFCVNFTLITRTMVELAGVFSKVNKSSPRFAMLKKATCNPNNGQNVYFADYDYRASYNESPDKLYIKTPHFSNEVADCLPLRTVALLNKDEESKKITLRAEAMGLDPSKKYILTDVWSGAKHILSGDISFELIPHESYLFSVNDSVGMQIYDANIKLSEVITNDNVMTAKTSYAADAELSLSQMPREVWFNGARINYTINKGNIHICIPASGELKIVF